MQTNSLLLIGALLFISTACSVKLRDAPDGNTVSPVDTGPLQVISVSPNRGTAQGGTQITLTGAGFQPGITVSLGGVSCVNVVFVSPVSIMCTTPRYPVATVPIVVTNLDGTTANLNNAYTFIDLAKTVPGFAVLSGGGPLRTATGIQAHTTVGEVVRTKILTGPGIQLRPGVHSVIFSTH